MSVAIVTTRNVNEVCGYRKVLFILILGKVIDLLVKISSVYITCIYIYTNIDLKLLFKFVIILF